MVWSGNYFATGSVILREMNATDKKVFGLVKIYKKRRDVAVCWLVL